MGRPVGESPAKTPAQLAAWAISPEGKDAAFRQNTRHARASGRSTRAERLVRHYEGILRIIALMGPTEERPA